MIQATEEKSRLLEFAAMQAAKEGDNPVLARAIHNYRIRNRMSVEQVVSWLGLTSREDFFRLALCLKPGRKVVTPLDWRDYVVTLGEKFPPLNLKRLKLVIETEEPNDGEVRIYQRASGF